MNIDFINAGYGNVISAHRVVAIVGVDSAPIKRYIENAEEQGKLINANKGRKWRSAIITDSNHVILSALQPETVANRIFSERDALLKDSALKREEELEEEELEDEEN